MTKLDEILLIHRNLRCSECGKNFGDVNFASVAVKQQIKSLFLELIDGDPDSVIWAETEHINDWGNGYRAAIKDLRERVKEL
ncbi:MAG TPA: hypothetical protein VNX65_02285 [Patescibacteria group bacterium]|jgi:hypothetical protein|nr:hypothetical protein [Patescibacteria group bacterium]